ncbi:uncharacterized protein LOC134529243 [Bacillus rossius redtenbacheri]|uniref:uncharacterized protein LOC134529243 n=1 Tax=Bacillus rossius redtenbacheri TaxID=93214 RepID=UPI002FDDB5F3
MHLKLALVCLCVVSMAVVCTAGGGGHHKKVIIHVPHYVKKIHHTHTVYKIVDHGGHGEKVVIDHHGDQHGFGHELGGGHDFGGSEHQLSWH